MSRYCDRITETATGVAQVTPTGHGVGGGYIPPTPTVVGRYKRSCGHGGPRCNAHHGPRATGHGPPPSPPPRGPRGATTGATTGGEKGGHGGASRYCERAPSGGGEGCGVIKRGSPFFRKQVRQVFGEFNSGSRSFGSAEFFCKNRRTGYRWCCLSRGRGDRFVVPPL